jgi:flavin-dependent dehydrogenase
MDLTEKKPSRNLLNEQSFKTTGEALDLVSSKFDVLVVGAGTAGIYFAQKMAEAKYTVCVIEKSDEKDLGSRLNIFHIDKVKFEEFNVPEPKPGDEDFVDVFNFSISKSAEDKYPKKVEYPFVVSLLPKFLKRLKNQAVKAGVTFVFETTFNDFIYNDQKQIIGANVKTNKGNKQISARLVVDASGIPAVARTKLPLNSKVENFALSPRDMFYVTLRYVKLKNPKTDAIKFTTSWPYYKTWTAPSLDPNGAIYGVGSNLSFETGEKIYQEFIKHVKLPEATLDKIEKGYVPYHRSPYSLVTDGFICLGDAACMTKPYSGEGIVAA